MTDRWYDEAERVFHSLWDPGIIGIAGQAVRPKIVDMIAAALRGAARTELERLAASVDTGPVSVLATCGRDVARWLREEAARLAPDQPATPKPVSRPAPLSNGEGVALGRPVTYRAGTVPARIEVGMVLRGPYGHTYEIVRVGEYMVDANINGLSTEPVLLLAAQQMTLARDFTEPGGGES
jgi:hypothetical protein